MEILYSVYEVFSFALILALCAGLLTGYLYFHFKFYDRRWFTGLSLLLFPAMAAAACTALALTGNLYRVWLWFVWAQLPVTLFFKHVVRGKNKIPYLLLAPAFAGLALLLLYPFFFEVYLSFHDLRLATILQWRSTGHLEFVGLRQYIAVFTSSPLAEVSFWALLARTIWWTIINVGLHVAGGFALALLLNNKIKFKGLYRTLLVIPWAMPQVVAILAMRGEFHAQYGFINIMLTKLAAAFPLLASIGLGPVKWLGDYPLLTCTMINVWLGIPFMMVVILGGLQSISSSYYDAADIDGANYIQKLRYITLPLVKPVLMPAVTLGTVWTFNNINVIYLVTGQSGGTEQADILVSALYKAAFTYNRYSYSAAFALIIFAILFLVSVFYLKTFDAAKDER